MKIQDKIIVALLAQGCTELPSGSKKYRKFTHRLRADHPVTPDKYYWVGARGALRVGKTISSSLSFSWHFRKGN